MRVVSLFTARIRGVRLVDLSALGCLMLLILGVYAFKAHAGRETAQIAEVDQQIDDETRQVRLLRARLAKLEQPARLERLSSAYLGLAPAQAAREAAPEGLSDLAHAAPAPSPTGAPAVTP